MPPMIPGDPGDGDGDEDEFRPPLPPEDRIWRHPSEVAAFGLPPSGIATPRPRRTRGLPLLPRRGILAVAAVSALIGATGSVGVLAAVGRLDTTTAVVERQIVVQPVTNADDDQSTIATITKRTAPSVASVRIERSTGMVEANAVVFRSDGYLLTAAHMVEDADRIIVRVAGQTADATVVGSDSLTDIAVLHVPIDGLDPADVGSSRSLTSGDETYAVGVARQVSNSPVVSTAILSAIGTRTTIPDGTPLHGMMLIDTALTTGTAGCALVDRYGAVVGLANTIAVDAERTAVTPMDTAVSIADQLVASGYATHPWLGVSGSDLGIDTATAMGVPGGAAVAEVMTEGPAAVAGIRPGDVITHVDGTPVASMADLVNALRAHEVGDEVMLRIHRDEEASEATVVVGERPVEG